MANELDALEAKIGYSFRDRRLLERALTHRSGLYERAAANPQGGDNEQLEFLGDAVLGFIVAESLVSRHPEAREGALSQWKSHLVSSAHLHQCALELGLGEYLFLGKGEERNGGRERRNLLADALEALIAAVHLDGGIGAAQAIIQRHVLNVLDDPEAFENIGAMNFKSLLQERAQLRGLPVPHYFIVATDGPEHAKVFTVEARIGTRFVTRATGSSKKAASQEAAQLLMQEIGEDAL
jgi:ribonuclease-3